MDKLKELTAAELDAKYRVEMISNEFGSLGRLLIIQREIRRRRNIRMAINTTQGT